MNLKKLIYNLIMFLTILFLCILFPQINVCAGEAHDNKNIRICIDPGHGGENLGGQYEDYTEKDINLVVAKAMKEELEKYEGIEVFLTREDDRDMELKERVSYAADVGADFFFCLHFNMSVNHDIYGTECWISAFGENYARGMDFARIEMNLLTDLGLYDRGVKTRLNSKGTNYYGVLRIADEKNIPGIIIEHCHLDNYNDRPFYDKNEWLQTYGRLDATAVAKYYGLKSDILGTDYSDNTYSKMSVPDKKVSPDYSEPQYCNVNLGDYVQMPVPMTGDSFGVLSEITVNEELEAGRAGVISLLEEDAKMKYSLSEGEEYRLYKKVEITGEDAQSRLLYYDYSYDGGKTWSERYRFYDEKRTSTDGMYHVDGTGDYSPGRSAVQSKTVYFLVPYDKEYNLKVRIYNLYDLIKESNPLYCEAVSASLIPEEDKYEGYTDVVHPIASEEDNLNDNEDNYLVIGIALCAGLLLAMMLTFILLNVNRSMNKKRRRRKAYKDGNLDKYV